MPVPSKKLWLDDIRKPPDSSWHWARTIEQARLVVFSHDIQMASLDHDMGLHEFDPDAENADVMRVPAKYRCYDCQEICDEVYSMREGFFTKPVVCPDCGSEALIHVGDPDGAEFAKWLVQEDHVPPEVVIHTMNPVGGRRIFNILLGHCADLSIIPFDPSCRNA